MDSTHFLHLWRPRRCPGRARDRLGWARPQCRCRALRAAASRRGCTPVAAGVYGTGVGRSGVAGTAGGVYGFPAALTSFIGRDGPVGEVTGLLEKYRLVTVTGPGGSGKT